MTGHRCGLTSEAKRGVLAPGAKRSSNVRDMGTLEYNSARPPIDVDDETLAHIKIVIGTKLRRGESFMMTWLTDETAGAGRITIWMHPSIPLVMEFDDHQMPKIDEGRIVHMMEHLNARGELLLDLTAE